MAGTSQDTGGSGAGIVPALPRSRSMYRDGNNTPAGQPAAVTPTVRVIPVLKLAPGGGTAEDSGGNSAGMVAGPEAAGAGLAYCPPTGVEHVAPGAGTAADTGGGGAGVVASNSEGY